MVLHLGMELLVGGLAHSVLGGLHNGGLRRLGMPGYGNHRLFVAACGVDLEAHFRLRFPPGATPKDAPATGPACACSKVNPGKCSNFGQLGALRPKANVVENCQLKCLPTSQRRLRVSLLFLVPGLANALQVRFEEGELALHNNDGQSLCGTAAQPAEREARLVDNEGNDEEEEHVQRCLGWIQEHERHRAQYRLTQPNGTLTSQYCVCSDRAAIAHTRAFDAPPPRPPQSAQQPIADTLCA